MLAPTQYSSSDLSPLPQLLTGKPTFHSLPPVNLQKATKKEISDYFENAFDLNETLFTSVKYSHDFYVNPDELRLILMFYLVYPASLFVNKLMLTGALNARIDTELETMCETGVDEMSWDDAVTVSSINFFTFLPNYFFLPIFLIIFFSSQELKIEASHGQP